MNAETPNSAFELTRYGRPLLPGRRCLQHSLHPGKSVPPTRSAQFDVRHHQAHHGCKPQRNAQQLPSAAHGAAWAQSAQFRPTRVAIVAFKVARVAPRRTTGRQGAGIPRVARAQAGFNQSVHAGYRVSSRFARGLAPMPSFCFKTRPCPFSLGRYLVSPRCDA